MSERTLKNHIRNNVLFAIWLLVFGTQFAYAAVEREDLIFIPVVFHIVYSVDEENISDEQILSQIVSLNDDFRSRNIDLLGVGDDFKASIGDGGIEFVYANKIIDFPVDPIIRVESDKKVFFNSDLFESSKGGSNPIEENRILNVWVANLSEGLLGFYDQKGIAIDFKNFGTNGTAESPHDLGRTLTHEVGHFFSLKHLWGIGGCDSDDGVNDTPTQFDEILGCDLESISCGSRDMTQNFMNTSLDHCLLFFTKGQIEKMRNYIVENLPEMILEKNEIVLEVNEGLRTVNFYPNPANEGLIYFEGIPSNVNFLILFSLGGRLIGKYPIAGRSVQLNDIEKGVYILKLEGDNYYKTSKMIVE
ncbi:zinc-dependent metalloprotease [Ekhidna sp.]